MEKLLFLILLTQLAIFVILLLNMLTKHETRINIPRDYDTFLLNQKIYNALDRLTYITEETRDSILHTKHSLVNIHYILGAVYRQELLDFVEQKEKEKQHEE